MLEQLLQWGYDASLPVDEFLSVEFHACCCVCGHTIQQNEVVLQLFRTQFQEAERALGPLLHQTHVVLVDLVE